MAAGESSQLSESVAQAITCIADQSSPHMRSLAVSALQYLSHTAGDSMAFQEEDLAIRSIGADAASAACRALSTQCAVLSGRAFAPLRRQGAAPSVAALFGPASCDENMAPGDHALAAARDDFDIGAASLAVASQLVCLLSRIAASPAPLVATEELRHLLAAFQEMHRLVRSAAIS